MRGSIYWVGQALRWSNTLFYLGLMFAVIFPCGPREAIWNLQTQQQCNLNLEKLFLLSGAFNIVWDTAALMYPLYAIWKLQIPMKRKLGVYAVFTTAVM